MLLLYQKHKIKTIKVLKLPQKLIFHDNHQQKKEMVEKEKV